MTLPWRGTTPEISSEADSRYETPGGAQNKANEAFNEMKTIVDLAIITGDSGPEASTARYSTPYGITYPILKDRLDAMDLRFKNLTVFNVKDYGAVGDGNTNDTTAIQNSIDAAVLAGDGQVYFPSGIYKITSVLEITGNLEICGENRDTSIIHAFNCNGMTSDGNVVIIRDLAFKTNSSNAYIGIIIENSNYNKFSDLFFGGIDQNTDYWGVSFNCKGVWYSSIERLLIQGGIINVHYRGIGIKCEYSVNNVISQCVIDSSNICINFTNAAHPTLGYYCEGWKITQNTPISSNIGVKIDRGLFFTITDNMFDFQQQYGIIMDVPLQGGGVISNNWIAMQGPFAGSTAIRINNSDRLVIANNVITGTTTTGQFGIYLNSRFVSIGGNSLVGFNKGIYVTSDSVKVAIDGNTFITNTTDIEYYGLDGSIQNHSPSAIIAVASSGNNYQTKSKYTITKVAILVGGSNTEIIDVPIPAYAFSSKPLTGWININGNNPLVGNYLVDDINTTATNARFLLRHLDVATNIIAGSVRISILLSDADISY